MNKSDWNLFFGPFPVLHPGVTPERFTNPSQLCTPENLAGTLLTAEGRKLSWMPRCQFLPSTKRDGDDHIAKTPYHAIRWAIDQFTEPGDLVLDPFMGSGTTGVEAMLQGRKTWGAELEFSETTRTNLAKFGKEGVDWSLVNQDAEFALDQVQDASAALLNLSNPYPEGRDHNARGSSKRDASADPKLLTSLTDPKLRINKRYQDKMNAGLMSGEKYWQKMKAIQDKSCEKLKPGGYAIFVIKDILENRKVVPLHEQLAGLLPDYMEFQQTVLLEHYPPTLHMNTYEKRWGTRPPMEQVCPIFRKRA